VEKEENNELKSLIFSCFSAFCRYQEMTGEEKGAHPANTKRYLKERLFMLSE
jgi:hypothetical protein